MRQLLRNLGVGLVMIFSLVSAGSVFVPPVANAAACGTGAQILGMPYWYDGLQETKTVNGKAQCVITITADKDFQDIWVIVTNCINILLHIIGLVAVAFVIYGGIRYIISQGNPGDLQTAKSTIVRALIGLVIAIASVFILNFLVVNVLGLKLDAATYQVTGTK